jgi:hypothetical protein
MGGVGGLRCKYGLQGSILAWEASDWAEMGCNYPLELTSPFDKSGGAVFEIKYHLISSNSLACSFILSFLSDTNNLLSPA